MSFSFGENKHFSSSSLSFLVEEECMPHCAVDLHTVFLMRWKVEALLGRYMKFSRSDTSFPFKFLKALSMLP